ncbi:MAG: hypothetical protein C0600_11950 [Ignavibacteria bacterium]|nr:MAG: hypothetical protein C0600_11950 [Ignavibacteria bacterium]
MERRLLRIVLPLLLCAPLLTAQTVLVEDYRFGDFSEAVALSVDQFGGVFVVDAGASSIYKYDIRGGKLGEFGGAGWDNTQFDRPSGIDASLGLAVYVSDEGNNRVARFDRGLHFMAALSGDAGSLEQGFGYPLDVVNSALEDLYVLDGENHRVIAFSGFNRVTDVFGDIASGDGRLTDPVAMAMGGSRLYVLESHRVAAFDLFGNFLFAFGSGHFDKARGITASGKGVLVVTDDALHFFQTDGTFIRTIERNAMVLAGDSGVFRDAAYTPRFLLLLTNRSCIIFPNN